MNKTQIVAAFAEKAGITKTDASKFFNALMGVMADNIVEEMERFPSLISAVSPSSM